ncbi:hypothetical protein ACWGQ5_55700 [Streptomyces sp. NPDC055722]
MGTERDWAYRVEEPHGSEGWRPYDGPERWRGTITTEEPDEAEYVAALVVKDLVSKWKANDTGVKHVLILVWEDEEGEDLADAVYAVEVRPDLHDD